jgi:hypothetical protein
MDFLVSRVQHTNFLYLYFLNAYHRPKYFARQSTPCSKWDIKFHAQKKVLDYCHIKIQFVPDREHYLLPIEKSHRVFFLIEGYGLLWRRNWTFIYILGNANNVIDIKNVALESQQCVTFVLLCCMSLSTMLLWRLYIAGKNKTHLGLRVKRLVFLSDFNQIWIFSDKSH